MKMKVILCRYRYGYVYFVMLKHTRTGCVIELPLENYMSLVTVTFILYRNVLQKLNIYFFYNNIYLQGVPLNWGNKLNKLKKR